MGRKQDVLVAVENLVFKGMVDKESPRLTAHEILTITEQGLDSPYECLSVPCSHAAHLYLFR